MQSRCLLQMRCCCCCCCVQLLLLQLLQTGSFSVCRTDTHPPSCQETAAVASTHCPASAAADIRERTASVPYLLSLFCDGRMGGWMDGVDSDGLNLCISSQLNSTRSNHRCTHLLLLLHLLRISNRYLSLDSDVYISFDFRLFPTNRSARPIDLCIR